MRQIVIALLLGISALSFAAESATAAPAAPVVATPVAATAAPVVDAAPAPVSSSTAAPIASVAGSAIGTFLVFFGGIIVTVLGVFFKKIAAKFGFKFDATTEKIVEDVLLKGVHAAEEWAKTQAAKPTGESKMATALKTALELTVNNPTAKAAIDTYAVAKLKAKVEALLASPATPESMTPKA